MDTYTCLDCGNTTDFRVLYNDWSLWTKHPKGGYEVTDSLSYGEAMDSAHPMECHNCDSTNIRTESV
jgi:hypothetical protein